jgi:hypothetical protein
LTIFKTHASLEPMGRYASVQKESLLAAPQHGRRQASTPTWNLRVDTLGVSPARPPYPDFLTPVCPRGRPGRAAARRQRNSKKNKHAEARRCGSTASKKLPPKKSQHAGRDGATDKLKEQYARSRPPAWGGAGSVLSLRCVAFF